MNRACKQAWSLTFSNQTRKASRGPLAILDQLDGRRLSVRSHGRRGSGGSGLARSPDIRGDFTHLLTEDLAGVGIMQQSSKIGFERCAVFPEQVRCGA